MATRSFISIEVPQEYIGKTLKFDRSKFKQRLVDMGKNGYTFTDAKTVNTEEVTITKKYLSIYHHWDSDFLIDVLPKAFNNVDEIINLMLLGDCSSIKIDEVVPYICRNNGNFVEWDEVAPIQCDAVDELPVEDYNFLFKNGKWQWLESSNRFI